MDAPVVETSGSGGEWRYLIVLWFTLNIVGGHVLLPILIATFTFTGTKRHITLVNLCIVFVFTDISACLLLYTNSFNGPPPNRAVCFYQATGIDSFPPAWATALLMLCWHMWSSSNMNGASKWATAKKVVMVVAPYLSYAVFFVAAAMIGALDPSLVRRSPRHIYCQVFSNTLGMVSGACTSAAIIIAIGLTVHHCIRLWRSYRYLKSRNVMHSAPADLSLVLRLALFVLYCTIGLIFSMWTTISQPDPALRDIYIATLSTVIFLAFGTQMDVLRTWCFWRYWRRNHETSVISVERHLSDGQPTWISPAESASVKVPSLAVIDFHSEPYGVKALPPLPDSKV